MNALKGCTDISFSSNSSGLTSKEAETTGLIPQETLDNEKAALDARRTFEYDSGPSEEDT